MAALALGRDSLTTHARMVEKNLYLLLTLVVE